MDNSRDTDICFSFSKAERLCRKKIIDKLFEEGTTVYSFPVKIVYIEIPLLVSFPAQVAFAVSKKMFKRAVQRNLIKRRMREAYRLSKPKFYNELGNRQVAVFFIFSGKTIASYTETETAIKSGLKKLIAGLTRQ